MVGEDIDKTSVKWAPNCLNLTELNRIICARSNYVILIFSIIDTR